MQGPAWIALFQRIPANYHDGLALTLVTGAEIIVQALLKLEADFVLLRGRMAGSTDPARVIVLPFDQIVNVAFLKRMLQAEVANIFGELQVGMAGMDAQQSTPPSNDDHTSPANGIADTLPVSQFQKLAASAVAQKPPPQSVPGLVQPAIADAQAGQGTFDKTKAGALSKSIFLERLRARLAELEK